MGLTEIFSKIGLKAGPSIAIPKLLYWLILLAFIKVAADRAGIEDISNLLDQIMAFLPKVLTASIILLVGFIVADLIQNAAFRSLDNWARIRREPLTHPIRLHLCPRSHCCILPARD